jgi:hypothetical protein
MSDNYISSNINKVNGMQSKSTNKYSAPVNFNVGNGVIGSYDNIKFSTTCKTNPWKAPPCNPPEKDQKLYVPQGTPLPLKNEVVYMSPPTNSIFPFNRTFSSPDCRSMYSSSQGQLCLPETQQNFIGVMRGGNKTYENYNF